MNPPAAVSYDLAGLAWRTRPLALALADSRTRMAPELYARLAVYAATRLPARDLQNVYLLDAYRSRGRV